MACAMFPNKLYHRSSRFLGIWTVEQGDAQLATEPGGKLAGRRMRRACTCVYGAAEFRYSLSSPLSET